MDIFAPLLQWYELNRRDLPWRHTRNPYRIWVSEIMLQQTRAAAVIPYYERFFEALPSLGCLAACGEEQLLKLWEGLGYYSRARNLKACAVTIMNEYGGRFPEDAETLVKLPGIGAYTAGAIASIAFQKPEPAVDGNVLRILARFRNDGRDVLLPAVREDCRAFLLEQDLSRAGDLNQAFMDLGSLICLPKSPKCGECPLKGGCASLKAGTSGELPYREKKKPRRVEDMTVFCLRAEQGEIARKRPSTGLLPGLYEYPHVPGRLTASEAAEEIGKLGARPRGSLLCYERKHVFTHVEWHMTVYACEADAVLKEGCVFLTEKEPLPTAFLKCRPGADG